MNNDKLVSIVMATYNGEKYLEEQIESIITQTYINLEIIICDDNSTDKTLDILSRYEILDKRIKIISNKKNLGFKKNFEKVINLSEGEYIALSDQDDIWKEKKIEILLNNIEDFDLIHSSVSLINNRSEIIQSKWNKLDNYTYSFRNLVFGNTVTGCTLLFHKSILNEFSPIPSGEKYHDWWLALLATRNRGIRYIEDSLVLYRQHEEQDTSAGLETKIVKLIRLGTNFFHKRKSKRYQKALWQIERLESYKRERSEFFLKEENSVINDALEYYTEYINSFFHLKCFYISLKYSKEIHYKNPFFIKSFLFDIIG